VLVASEYTRRGNRLYVSDLFFFKARTSVLIPIPIVLIYSRLYSATYEVSRILQHQFVNVLSTKGLDTEHVAHGLTSFDIAEVVSPNAHMASGWIKYIYM
jgi:hypothetical protein